jgi:hypothetical protein
MKPRTPFARLAVIASATLVLAACGGETSESQSVTDDAEEARGSYDIDTVTGETRAEYTDEDGTTTTMRSGESVPVELPTGFTVYPGAKVVNNTRVQQADGLLVLLNLESDDSPEKMVAFYRKQAEAAGIDIAMTLQSGPMTMIGGEKPEGASFSFTATREGEVTSAQLSVGAGLE